MRKTYKKSGVIQASVGAVIFLIVGMAIASMVNIFTGTLSGKTYSLMEDDIDSITNTTIKDSIKSGIISGFEAQKQTADFLPLIVMALVITIVLIVLLSIPMVGGIAGGGNRGSAL
jgi:hypothetical protein